MHHKAWSTSMIAPIAALVTALSSTTVHADCAYLPMKQQPLTVDVIYLGHYVDLLGHQASFYFDSKTSRVIGPIDHDRNPANRRPGQAGRLTFRALVPDPPVANQPVNAGVIASMGFFAGFADTGATMDLRLIIPRISDPLVIGLLAGDGAFGSIAEKQLAAIAAVAEKRSELAIAMQGVLYAATKDRAFQLFKGYGFHDLFGGDPTWVVILKHEGLAGLEARAKGTGAGAQDWLAYLPDLAVAWKQQRGSLDGKLDDLMLGQHTPTHPFLRTDGAAMVRHKCGPTREQIHGPFQGRGDVSQRTVVDMLGKIDPQFVKRLERAFTGIAAAPNAIVLDKQVSRGRTLVTATELGEVGVVELDPKQAASITRGTRLAIVARRSAGAEYIAIPHLAQNESILHNAGSATRLKILGKDEPALIATLRERVKSGNLGHSAGLALATLFDLVGSVPSWKIDDFRKAIWTLPGNQYGTANEWANAWREILMYALRYSTNPAFAIEVERAMPAIVQNFARQYGNKRSPTIAAEPVRGFAIEVGIQNALLYVRTGDLAGAERVLVTANGPLAPLAGPGTPVGPEAQRDSNRDSQLRIARVLVRGLAKRDARDLRPPNPDHLSFDLSMFNHIVRAYAPHLKKPWQQAVVAAGHPEPPLYD